MNKYYLTLMVSSIVVISDQLTKYLVRSTIPLHSGTEVLPFFDITHLRNPGIAFGMLRDMPENLKIPFFIVVLIAALVVIFYMIKSTHNSDKSVIISLSLILGGAIGNSIDRFRLGYVTDFLHFHWFGHPDYSWPPFNVSDSCITVGAVMIVILSIFYSRGKK